MTLGFLQNLHAWEILLIIALGAIQLGVVWLVITRLARKETGSLPSPTSERRGGS